MKTAYLYLLVLLALLGLGALAYTGLVTFHETTEGVVVGDAVTIAKGVLTDCCTFVREGKTKTCSVIEPFECGYCDAFCGDGQGDG